MEPALLVHRRVNGLKLESSLLGLLLQLPDFIDPDLI